MDAGVFGDQYPSMLSPYLVEGGQNLDLAPGNLSTGLKSNSRFPPHSAQSDIVKGRSNRVKEQFGQVTPPDSAPESSAARSSNEPSAPHDSRDEIAKQNRTQRARNAANKRHSKLRASENNEGHDDRQEVDEGVQDPSKSTSMQREKNRVAAAKCRAKKKANSEEMQETHRDGARRNSYLVHEVRELRDQKALLRNTLLQHGPGICQCHAIHQFNMAQAQQLAFGVGGMLNQPLSPSQESGGSGQTPRSDGSAGMAFPTPSSIEAHQRKMSVPSRPQSLAVPPNYEFGQIMSPDPTMSMGNALQDPSQMQQQFTDFLHDSSQARAGFS